MGTIAGRIISDKPNFQEIDKVDCKEQDKPVIYNIDYCDMETRIAVYYMKGEF